MSGIVLDASAAVEIALWTERGKQLASVVQSSDSISVPRHFLAECANALRRLEVRGTISTAESERALSDIRAIDVDSVDVNELLGRAWEMRHNVTIPDGLYVALAERDGAPLVTGDERLTRAPQVRAEVVAPRAPSDPSPHQVEALRFASEVYLRGLWTRVLPPGAVQLISELVRGGPATRAQLDRRILASDRHGHGLKSIAWELPHLWTDAELADHEQEFGPDEDGLHTATEVIESEGRDLACQIAESDRLSAMLGVPPLRSLDQVLHFMLAANLLIERDDGSIWIDPLAPLPEEVLDLADSEQQLQAHLRWRTLFDPLGDRIIGLFEPDALNPAVLLMTSLQQLGNELEADPESVRAAILGLLEDGDFSSDADIARTSTNTAFELRVDWDRFNRSRIQITSSDQLGSSQ